MVRIYLHVKEQFFSGEIKNTPLDLIIERIVQIWRVSTQKSKGVFIFCFLSKKTGNRTEL
jgi:hypothetical protein